MSVIKVVLRLWWFLSSCIERIINMTEPHKVAELLSGLSAGPTLGVINASSELLVESYGNG